jgi:hypothetical protein
MPMGAPSAVAALRPATTTDKAEAPLLSRNQAGGSVCGGAGEHRRAQACQNPSSHGDGEAWGQRCAKVRDHDYGQAREQSKNLGLDRNSSAKGASTPPRLPPQIGGIAVRDKTS